MPFNVDALNNVRALNNRACCLLQHRRYDQAIETLISALRETKKTAQDEAKSDAENNSSYAPISRSINSEESASSHTRQCPTVRDCSEDHDLEDSQSSDETDDSDFASPKKSSLSYTYEEPVFIDEYSCDENVITHLSVSIMFNFALSHHLKGRDSCDPDTINKAYLIAKRLYELIFQLQTQEKESDMILVAALLNNLSLVHKALLNHCEATQFQQLLLSTLLLLVDMGDSGGEHASELDGFMGNVFHLLVKKSPAASAA